MTAVDAAAARRLRGPAAWTAVVIALTLLGRVLAEPGLPVGPVSLVSGATVVWLVQTGGRDASAAVVAVALAATVVPLLLLGVAAPVAVGHGVGVAVLSAVTVVLVRRWCPALLGAGGSRSVHDPTTLARGVAAVAVGTAAGVVPVELGGLLAQPLAPGEVLLTWTGFFSGIVLLAPPLHLGWEAWLRRRGDDAVGTVAPTAPGAGAGTYGNRRELDVVVVLGLALTAWIFSRSDLPLGFLVIVVAVWAGSRFPTAVVAPVVSCVGLLALVLSVLGRGPFGGLETGAAAAVGQAFAVTVVLTGLAVSTSRDERLRLTAESAAAHRAATARADLLDAMAEAMDEGLVVVDAESRILRTNRAARAMLSLTETGFQQRTADYRVYHPDGTLLTPDELPSRRVMRERVVPAVDLVLRDGRGHSRTLSVNAAALPDLDDPDGAQAVVVYRDVTRERRRTQQADDFAGMAAHDLRNPLTSASGWLELAADGLTRGDDGLVREAVERASGATRRMQHLVADLLEQARAEGGPLEPALVVLDGDDGLVAEVVRDLGVGPEVAEVRVGPVDPVEVDPGLFRQVLVNLVGNAVKYVEPGRRACVEVSGETRDGRVRVTVADRGIGVPDDLRERVFDRYVRAPDLGRSYAGTGLGLAICRTVVERHGGTITCEPRPGGGTCFAFDLPLAR